jgi:hypothetical protein
MVTRFRLAPMSPVILILTLALLMLPLVFFIAAQLRVGLALTVRGRSSVKIEPR